MVYYDSCEAKITADADVGGYGVMASFIFISWMTTFLSAWAAWTTWRNKHRQHQDDEVEMSTLAPPGQVSTSESFRGRKATTQIHNNATTHPSLSSNPPISMPREPQSEDGQPRGAVRALRTPSTSHPTKIKAILIRLIDLQIITGMGITIAGLTQIVFSSPSYYHYELINGYWWLTMQSLWIVPEDFLDIAILQDKPKRGPPYPTTPTVVGEKSKNQRPRSPIIRILAVLVSTVLGCFFQMYILVVENNSFDNDPNIDVTGPCYNFLYGPVWEWTGAIWVVMTGSYATTLIFLLFEWTRSWILDTADDKLWVLGEDIYAWWEASYKALWATSTGNQEGISRPFFVRVLTLFVSTLCACLYWMFVQFLAVCAYRDGFYPVVFLICAGFNAWTTVDILSMRILNEALLEGDEKKMGFGQVLPLVLIFSVFLPSMGVAGDHGTRVQSWEIRRARTARERQLRGGLVEGGRPTERAENGPGSAVAEV